MARHKRSVFEKETEPRLDISSLIDICFLVLIYFLVAMSVVPAERDLAMALPSTGKHEESQPPIPPMVLRIDGQGNVFSGNGLSERVLDVDAESRDLPLLTSQLDFYTTAARSAGDHRPVVLLRVDDGARQQRLIDVLNSLSAAGISSVAFEDLVRL